MSRHFEREFDIADTRKFASLHDARYKNDRHE
jgi:hypothetical protein